MCAHVCWKNKNKTKGNIQGTPPSILVETAGAAQGPHSPSALPRAEHAIPVQRHHSPIESVNYSPNPLRMNVPFLYRDAHNFIESGPHTPPVSPSPPPVGMQVEVGDGDEEEQSLHTDCGISDNHNRGEELEWGQNSINHNFNNRSINNNIPQLPEEMIGAVLEQCDAATLLFHARQVSYLSGIIEKYVSYSSRPSIPHARVHVGPIGTPYGTCPPQPTTPIKISLFKWRSCLPPGRNMVISSQTIEEPKGEVATSVKKTGPETYVVDHNWYGTGEMSERGQREGTLRLSKVIAGWESVGAPISYISSNYLKIDGLADENLLHALAALRPLVKMGRKTVRMSRCKFGKVPRHMLLDFFTARRQLEKVVLLANTDLYKCVDPGEFVQVVVKRLGPCGILNISPDNELTITEECACPLFHQQHSLERQWVAQVVHHAVEADCLWSITCWGRGMLMDLDSRKYRPLTGELANRHLSLLKDPYTTVLGWVEKWVMRAPESLQFHSQYIRLGLLLSGHLHNIISHRLRQLRDQGLIGDVRVTEPRFVIIGHDWYPSYEHYSWWDQQKRNSLLGEPKKRTQKLSRAGRAKKHARRFPNTVENTERISVYHPRAPSHRLCLCAHEYASDSDATYETDENDVSE